MQPEAVMTEDQVKVRFRKMFIKRQANKGTSSVDNASTHTTLPSNDLPMETGEEEEEVEDEPEDVSKNILSYTTHDGKMASLSSIPPITDLLFFKEKWGFKRNIRNVYLV